MNQSDTFVIHKRHLYTYGGNKRPFGMDSTYANKSNQKFNPVPQNEPSIFVVDWQMQNIEIQLVGENSNDGSGTVFCERSIEVKNSDEDLPASKRLTYNWNW